MNDKTIFDLTSMMEGLIDENLSEVEIMRQLMMTANGANATSHFNQFRIGDDVYTLEDMCKIEDQEEHEALVKRYRARKK